MLTCHICLSSLCNTILQPADPTESTVLAPGSSRDLVFKGGPQPWVLDPSQYFEQGNYFDIIYII